ncbi:MULTISPECIES: AI-2E family transporter [Sphingomonas]|uniref:AI-2E family transporter n=1 Tax=Sphingomonas TaxID=13687 RepID=UPI000DEEC4C5|nr:MULTISPECIES: AI-2E family transporter [Sphingomonas]
MAPPEPPHVEQPGPAEFRDPLVLTELKRAGVWSGVVLMILGVVFLAEPLLLIIGGLIFAVLLDGGARLLGRALPIPRGLRLVLVLFLGLGFFGWVLWYAGTTFAGQFEALRQTVEAQGARLLGWAHDHGLVDEDKPQMVTQQLVGSVGRLTSALGSAIGVITSAVLILALGIFFATEPKLYDRGVAWMLPIRHRDFFYRVLARVGYNLRRLLFGRLLGMITEGLFTWATLAAGGVPFAALLALITGTLAFIPNIGALISGALMVAVGFSAGPGTGVWAIVVYFAVHNIEGYVVMPYIARKTVDLAPAAVLAAQLIFGALFGFLGLLLADPILASLKVVLEEWARLGHVADDDVTVARSH